MAERTGIVDREAGFVSESASNRFNTPDSRNISSSGCRKLPGWAAEAVKRRRGLNLNGP
jgi:hypothetical protein